MVTIPTIIACAIALVCCLILPPVLCVVFAWKHKQQRLIAAWILGAAGFFVTQILIRVPILYWLQGQSWFLTFSLNHLFLYAFVLAFTAGLFELAGRFGVAKLMKNVSFNRSLAAGLGHGGIEAMVIAGSAYINNIAYSVMINAGIFDTVLAEAAAMGVDVSQLYLIRDTLLTASPALYLLGGYERILAMTCHAAMTMIVCYSMHRGKAIRGALICLGIHTLLDLTAGISLLSGTVLSQTTAYVIIYTILTAAAVISLGIVFRIRSNWPEKEDNHV